MRTRTTMVLVMILALGGMTACAEEGEPEAGMEGPDTAAEVSEAPEAMNWEVRLDDPEADQGGFQFMEDGGEYRIQTGPRAITYQGDQLASGGDFRVSGTFIEENAPADHREAYGIFFGGRNLQDPGVRYNYFLVRGTGEYLIKGRDGESTETVTDWSSSDAVEGTGQDGTSRNSLAVQVRGDSIRFLVNDQVVETLSTEEMNPYGVVGLRINHQLNVRVRDWTLDGDMVGGGEPPAGEGEAAGETGA